MTAKTETTSNPASKPRFAHIPSYQLVPDPTTGKHHYETTLRPQDILNNPVLNKVATLEDQVKRAYSQFCDARTPIQKNAFMNSMLDQNQVLYYRLIQTYLEEMLPIIYTPTEADAIANYSELFRRPRGVFLSYLQKDRIEQLLKPVLPDVVDAIVVTDAEMILGIGDQGVGGIWISVAKLSLFTALGGVHPDRVVPVVLDVGTDNEELLNDPLYTGWRHKRIRGKEYEDFVDAFVQAKTKLMSAAYLHWEDFGRDEARLLLDKYSADMCTFNDDLEGTGVIVLACVLSAMKHLKSSLEKQRIVVFGAGTAGTGIADRLASADPDIDIEKARQNIYLVDKDGLILRSNSDATKYQKPYAKDPQEYPKSKSLLDVVESVKPTILIGTSTCSGAFSKEVVEAMAKYCDRPIILPLSNPTRLCEADPEDLFAWTNNKCLVATGSPFPPVKVGDTRYSIAEANNVFVYPGIGMGCIVAGAKKVTDMMLRRAADAVANLAPNELTGSLMPEISRSQEVSFHVACAVARQCVEEGLATKLSRVQDVEAAVCKAAWKAEYVPVVRVKEL
ncbi:hypothetical protein DFS34DRAFT_648997 [Phlyctochytrium arcticum]|nr:hypothetical protein DFS34DRAFT_648997 [Phlyctochytrium arcticum]